MDAKYYCDTVTSELTALKARLYGMQREMERMPESEQESMKNEMWQINELVDELTDKVNSLRSECPSEWSGRREDIENTKDELMEKVDIWDAEHIAGGYVGG